MEYIFIAIALVVGIYVYKHRPVKDIVVPTPTVLRTDLLYTYYGALNNQAEETKDQINAWWESQFQGEDKAIENILATKMPTVLDVANQCMVKVEPNGRNHHYRDDCEPLLRAFFNKMKAAGALQYVKAIYPMDEPNTNTTSADLYKAIASIKKVAAEYQELADVKLMTIYAAKPETYECIELFDIVGVDDYDQKSQIFVNGTYSHLISHMRPDARTIIMPGGAFGQDPTPFINFAHNNKEVIAVVPFVWFNGMSPNDKWVGIGDDKNPLKGAYIEAGKKLTGK